MIGVSTGGPRTLEDDLPELPADFPRLVVVAQHMPSAVTGSFAARLDKICALNIVEVGSAQPLKRGQIYIGRGNADVIVDTRLGRSQFLWRPSVDRLVRSAMSGKIFLQPVRRSIPGASKAEAAVRNSSQVAPAMIPKTVIRNAMRGVCAIRANQTSPVCLRHPMGVTDFEPPWALWPRRRAPGARPSAA